MQISDALARRGEVKIFLQGLRSCNGILEEFDIRTWHALVDHVTVELNDTIVFHFRDGTSVSVDIADAIKGRKTK